MGSIYTVSQVNSYIKNMFTQDFALNKISVKGEVSNCKYHPSGHIYFTLKDGGSQIGAVMFASQRKNLGFRMEEGQQVVAEGTVDVYERDGKYQLYARSVTLDGTGDLFRRFEQLRNELEEMGMFDGCYKQPIPRYAKRVGVVTASTGAAIRDIMNISARRNPYVQLILYPALVQGAGAKYSIVKGIQTLDRMNLDVIIVGRGGGSLEDLWAFNTEQVARAVFECETPIISAVGHETDYTICDFVSDLRAPTPSAAAELAVPDSATLINYFDGIKNRLLSYLHNKIDKEYQLLDNLLINTPLEKMNDFINLKYDDLAVLQTRLVDGYSYFIEQKNNEFKNKVSRLDALSPLKILLRGYTLASINNNAINDINSVKVNDEIDITFYNGKSKCIVKEVTPNE